MSNPHDYTVGWICAIPTEYVAAQAFLDENHEGPDYTFPNDNNDYALGKIGRHNTVIAMLPYGEYGLSSAASVARDMLHSFPNVRIGLMVGIGGGAPSSKHDIRLGDVVVGVSIDGNGGVVQYDFGKAIQGQEFQETGFLNQPPTLLRAAVGGLMAQYESDGNQIQEAVDSALAKKPRLQKKYKRPEASSDRLYRTSVVHPAKGEAKCSTICGNDPSSLIERPERDEDDDNPAIHYGLIASANTLMKDASVRDELIIKKGVLCFEMEAAGLMNHFPCLVIRGICDYSDSHKNTEWQGYAAMTAVAYAKDLLNRIAPNKVEAEDTISDVLYGLQELAKEHRNISEKQLQVQKSFAKERQLKAEQECHQLFRLIVSGKDATYEWYKGRVEKRVEDTCLWFLKHEHFQTWLKQKSGPLLVTADPGCGKSVLAKYLIDSCLPRSATICYFFFKDQDQNTSRQALCAVLHQLFSQKPSLIEHAMPQFRTDGQSLINSTESLWKILRAAIRDPKAGPIIIVLDALDECAESELGGLIRNVESQPNSDHLSDGKLKYLLTCRPYERITSQFHNLFNSFPNIHIPGEEESEAISREINHVITHRVSQLSAKKNLSSNSKEYLETRLKETSHRTYLWVYLIFDYLEKEDFRKTLKGIERIITTLPRSINEAYEQILNKSKQDQEVRKALGIILAASRPLTLSEMNIAMSINNTTQDGATQTFHDLDLEDESDFKLRLRSWCGLFISIYHGKVYFLHQTAREFLLADLRSPIATQSALHWHHSITTHQAHNVLAELCVLYLNLFNSSVSPTLESNGKASHTTNSNAFLDYSAKNWGAHFREAHVIDDAAIIPITLRICDPTLKSFLVWFKIYQQSTHYSPDGNLTDLIIASYYGHRVIVKLLVKKGAAIEAKDSKYSRTPLLWAAQNGHEAIVKLLVEEGADIEAKDREGRTPLSLAALSGYETIVKLLVEKGANIEAKDGDGQTPLLWAALNSHEAIMQLLVERGANIQVKDGDGWTTLSLAALRGCEAIVNLLVKNGADIEAKDEDGLTPLFWAAQYNHKAIIKLLVKKGADVEAKDRDGQTPLLWAAQKGNEAIAKLLVEEGADIEAKNSHSQTPLSVAAQSGYEAIAKLLVGKGADIEAKDIEGRTPLLWAALNRKEAIVNLLVKKGADIEAKGEDGRTPLLWAAQYNSEAIAKLLIEEGADIETKDRNGRTPLSWAAQRDDEAIVKLLVEEGADIEAKDRDGRTPLSWAAQTAHEAVVKLLVEKGADIEAKDSSYSRTPLLWAAKGGDEAIIKLLIEEGANIKAKDENGLTLLPLAPHFRREAIAKLLVKKRGANIEVKDGRDGQTPLLWAAQNGHEAIVKLLVQEGADIEANDRDGQTPLLWAAQNAHEAIVKFLVGKGADIEAKDRNGQTPLSLAASRGYGAIVKLLVEKGANIKAKDGGGRTPLSLAPQYNREAIATLLVEKRAHDGLL